MWNPDQMYLAEQARRAEIYRAAEQARLVGQPSVTVRLVALAGRALRRLGERLEAAQGTRLSGEPRP